MGNGDVMRGPQRRQHHAMMARGERKPGKLDEQVSRRRCNAR